jgi:hypothetical protein
VLVCAETRPEPGRPMLQHIKPKEFLLSRKPAPASAPRPASASEYHLQAASRYGRMLPILSVCLRYYDIVLHHSTHGCRLPYGLSMPSTMSWSRWLCF